MNRSVINLMIAAGVLSAGVGFAPAHAVADPADPGTSSPDAPRPARPKGRIATENSDDGHGRDLPCEWSRICRPGQRKRWSGNSVMAGIPPIAPPVRPPVVAGLEPAVDLNPVELTSIGPGPAPPAAPAVVPTQAPSSAPTASAAVRPVPVPQSFRPASIPAVPAPAAPRPPLSSPVPLAPAAPPGAAPEPAAELLRLGYPDELRNADLAKMASTALPGLAAIAGMTVLGGLLGYRQAKAGYGLRAAGAGRFLQ